MSLQRRPPGRRWPQPARLHAHTWIGRRRSAGRSRDRFGIRRAGVV